MMDTAALLADAYAITRNELRFHAKRMSDGQAQPSSLIEKKYFTELAADYTAAANVLDRILAQPRYRGLSAPPTAVLRNLEVTVEALTVALGELRDMDDPDVRAVVPAIAKLFGYQRARLERRQARETRPMGGDE